MKLRCWCKIDMFDEDAFKTTSGAVERAYIEVCGRTTDTQRVDALPFRSMFPIL